MSLSTEELRDIETRNEERKELRGTVSKGDWAYDSFAWIEVLSTPRKERSCILIRRKSWFDEILQKYGTDFLDKKTTEGRHKNAIQPAHDGQYIRAALNDPIEEDIRKLISEVKRLRKALNL